jgi:hypothetical protein
MKRSMMSSSSYKSSFIEVDYFQNAKHGQVVAGDVFLSQKIKDENRVVAVLSDGLGSGIKANVLATLTATMALKYRSSSIDIKKTAATIMDTLPVCSVRKISYSTFTIIDIDTSGNTHIIEHDNPPILVIRDREILPLEKRVIQVDRWQDRLINISEFKARLGDRILFFSDGVSQAGMGEYKTPLGWGVENVQKFLIESISIENSISARALSRKVVNRARKIDGDFAKDDTTCAAIYFRKPRNLLVVTGPPFSMHRDEEVAHIVDTFQGKRIICGGTTSNIIARILDREIVMNMSRLDPEIPPYSEMEGVDLITEGTLTLAKVANILEEGTVPEQLRINAARLLVSMLLDSDVVHFIVGTRINEAHQDPNIPAELDLRRNIVKRIIDQLEHKYFKETNVEYI